MKLIALRAFGLLLLALGLFAGASHAPEIPVAALVARWAPRPSNFIEIQGQLVHLRDEGPRSDPEPIVLLHGESSSLHTWEGWAAALRTHRRVITLDLLGAGLTGPSSTGRYTPEAYTRFVLDVLDELRINHCVLGGHALGGEVAWRTALIAPRRISSLVLVAPTGFGDSSVGLWLGFDLSRAPGAAWIIENFLPRPWVARQLRQAYADPAKVTDDLVERHFQLAMREGNRHALAERLAQWPRQADAGLAARVSQPALILWGGQDHIQPPVAAAQFEQAMAESRLVMLPTLGHRPQEEDAALSLAPVKAFLGLP